MIVYKIGRNIKKCIPNSRYPVGCVRTTKKDRKTKKPLVYFNYNSDRFVNGICESEYRSRGRGKILDVNHNKTLDEILNKKKNECGLHFFKKRMCK